MSSQFKQEGFRKTQSTNANFVQNVQNASHQPVEYQNVNHYLNPPVFSNDQFGCLYNMQLTCNILYQVQDSIRISNLKLKNQAMNIESDINILQNKISDLKQTVKKQEAPENSLNEKQTLNSEITPEQLISSLYQKKHFSYKLVLCQQNGNKFSEVLYRERNFKFSVKLTDMEGNQVRNANTIPIKIALYSVDNPPTLLQKNTSGNLMLKEKGSYELIQGHANIEKIQIKEVSSHFRKGYFFMLVYPQQPFVASREHINYQLIKPLVIEQIVVKAKKSREESGNPSKKHSKNSLSDLNEFDSAKSLD